MYLNTHNPYECSGCAACYSICTHKAITMVEDEEGFIVPQRAMDKCVQCGMCEEVCPIEHPMYDNFKAPVVFAAYDSKNRRRSSSGGLFYALAQYVINKGGVVFGAAYDSNLQVHHISVDTKEGLERLRGSKYVQSYIGDAFRSAIAYLKQGRLVYFTGTPCQIAGLKACLHKPYRNLLTSDIVCHGVPNQHLFNCHLHYLSQQEGSKVVGYSFRDSKFWITREKADYSDGKVSYEMDGNCSPYLYAFGLGYIFRRSCFTCKFAHIPRQGDITLADYWGVGRFHPDLDDRGGVSLVLVNSMKGQQVWDVIKGNLKYRGSTLAACSTYNPNVIRPTREPKERESFFRQLAREGYDCMARTELCCPSEMRNSVVVLKMRLRQYGLWQPIDLLKVGLKRLLYATHLYGWTYKCLLHGK